MSIFPPLPTAKPKVEETMDIPLMLLLIGEVTLYQEEPLKRAIAPPAPASHPSSFETMEMA